MKASFTVSKKFMKLLKLPKPQKLPRGVVLIWTMLILMGLFGAASMIAIIMASSLRVAGSIDVGIPAFYAAESCLERAEYYITQQDGQLSRQAKVQRLNNPNQPQVPSLAGTLTNSATWTRSNAECVAIDGPPPDPCGKVFFSCIGSFKGTNAGLSILVD